MIFTDKNPYLRCFELEVFSRVRYTLAVDRTFDKDTLRLIQNGLRKASVQWRGRSEVLRRQKRFIPRYKKDGTRSKRDKVLYECEGCGELFDLSNVEVDHIDEVGSIGGNSEVHLAVWIARLFCDLDNLQVLCLACHQGKTNRFMKRLHSGNYLHDDSENEKDDFFDDEDEDIP